MPQEDDRMSLDFRWYIEHQDEMVERYNGRVIAIKDRVVLGSYSDYGEAIAATKKEHEPGTFILQLVSPGEKAYTVTIYSPVALG